MQSMPKEEYKAWITNYTLWMPHVTSDIHYITCFIKVSIPHKALPYPAADGQWDRECYREAPAASPLLLTHFSSCILLQGWNWAESRGEQVLVLLQTKPPWDTLCLSLYIPSTQPRISETLLLNFGLQALRMDAQMIFVNLLSIFPPSCS